ncbi:MAG: histidinol dehydrogenase [candidate division WOR-3 bacterium]
MRTITYLNLNEKIFEQQCEDILFDVYKIINEVKKYGDVAVNKYTKKFDKVALTNFRITPKDLKDAYCKIDKELMSAIKIAKMNIENFSIAQLKQLKNLRVKIAKGVIAEQKVIPINRIGIYVPGGKFPLISTVLMCGIPAIVAGVKEIVLCSPPGYKGSIHPAILATAKLLGIKEIYKIGGIQAIAALAYGTETIKPVDKIFGPGNIYVATAKKFVYGDVGIDFMAGPTEILIIADSSAKPEIIAADLLAQAEHDTNAVPILVTNSNGLAKKVKREIKKQLRFLKTKEIAEKSIQKNGLIIIVKNLNQAIDIANKKAPEHLELQIKNPTKYIKKLKNYGSLFVGRYSAEALGDYSSGLNHTLPTGGSARYTGGLHIKDFLKFQTVLIVDKNGLKKIGLSAEMIAKAEGLYGHFNSIKIREKY